MGIARTTIVFVGLVRRNAQVGVVPIEPNKGLNRPSEIT